MTSIYSQGRSDIFLEIHAERERQDEEWGGPAHDDDHYRWEWCNLIESQERRAYGEVRELGAGSVAEFESRMLKIAALAVAAIESSRRQR